MKKENGEKRKCHSNHLMEKLLRKFVKLTYECFFNQSYQKYGSKMPIIFDISYLFNNYFRDETRKSRHHFIIIDKMIGKKSPGALVEKIRNFPHSLWLTPQSELPWQRLLTSSAVLTNRINRDGTIASLRTPVAFEPRLWRQILKPTLGKVMPRCARALVLRFDYG